MITRLLPPLRLFAVLALALVALIALVANTGPPRKYLLDESASNVSAKVPFFGLSSKTARFPKMAGMVTIVPGAPEKAIIDVTFDATAIEAPDNVTLSRLRGDKFFWVEKYPEIRFVGRSLAFSDDRRGTVNGTLTARGVSRPAKLAVTFDRPPFKTVSGEAVSFEGTTTIDRRDFGMKSYQLVVGNKVEITLRARIIPR